MLAAGLLFLLLYLVFSKYGRIPLGLDGEEAEYSIGAEFDSTSEQATEWYGRTDEGGVPIPYDYDDAPNISTPASIPAEPQDHNGNVKA